MAGEISPVNAPWSSHATFWAPTRIGLVRRMLAISQSMIDGGRTTTSTAGAYRSSAGRSAFTNWMTSGAVKCIFQLPAISGLRMHGVARVAERGNAREGLPLEEFERGPAAGRDERHA